MAYTRGSITRWSRLGGALAWAANKVVVVAFVCAVGALWVAELLHLSGDVTAWSVGVAGGVFVGVIVFSAVRLIRRRDGPRREDRRLGQDR
jgi:hypothetical protein